MVRLLTASNGNQPTQYSMRHNDATKNSKREKEKNRNPTGRAYSDYLLLFLFYDLSLYEKKIYIYILIESSSIFDIA